jgi:predicted acetyltransferase
MRKYRRVGIGRKAAFHVFDRFRGTWKVEQDETNVVAQAFWRSVIGEYTDGDFEETDVDGPVQTFDSSRMPLRGL